MAYQSLYRKYRPSRMDDVVGQQNIIRMLENAIKKERISHAYLFCGPRGTGKTSVAKVFARAINCTSTDTIACGTCDNCIAINNNTHPDLVEIDAASNNGVDEIRGLIERVKYTPILGKRKVYIIDEVHMLTQGAFNALLKTLEEPPEHVVFILATTEIHKVIPTIISRCQRFDFMRIPDSLITQQLNTILEKENVPAEEGATKLIASLSGGGLRNALTILEQAIVLSDDQITIKQVYETNGMISQKEKISLFKSIESANMDSFLETMQSINSQSVQYERVLMDFISGLKDSLIYTKTNEIKYVDPQNHEFVTYLDQSMTSSQRQNIIHKLMESIERMRFSQTPEIYFEVAMLEIMSPQGEKVTPPVQNVEVTIENVTHTAPSSISKVEKQEEVPTPTQNTTVEPTQDIGEIHPPMDAFDEIEDEPEDVYIPMKSTSKNPQLQINLDTIVQLMVTANKDLRIQDEASFTKITSYRNNPSWARPARLLNGGKLVLSGNHFVLVAMRTDLEARELQEDRNQVELIKFSNELFSSQKTMLATSLEAFNEALTTFVNLSKTNALPDPLDETQFLNQAQDSIENEVDETMEAMQSLFGDALNVIK